MHADLVFSALGFHDPESSSFHTGLADDVFDPLWNKEKHMHLWDDVFRRTARFLKETRQKNATIMVYCKSGKHRSVVVALMLQHVLRRRRFIPLLTEVQRRRLPLVSPVRFARIGVTSRA